MAFRDRPDGLHAKGSIQVDPCFFKMRRTESPTDSNVCFPDVCGSRCLLQTRYLGGEKPTSVERATREGCVRLAEKHIT